MTRVKQVKLLAARSGDGHILEMRIESVRRAPEGATFVEAKRVEDSEEKVHYYPGMAVRFKDSTGKRKGVFVLTQRTQAGWFMSRLGGSDKNTRWHKVQETSIVPVHEINSVNWE